MSRRAIGWFFPALLVGSVLGLAGLQTVRGEKPAEAKPTDKKPAQLAAADKKENNKKPTEPFSGPINVAVPHISTDKTVKIDYDIAYVRAGRAGDTTHKRYYTDFSQPVTMEPGADLMLLHPDGSEDLLVAGGDGSVTDPMVSYDGKWIYYTLIHNLVGRNQWSPPKQGADIYKINVATRKIVKLTNQRFSPNTGVGNWTADFRPQKNNNGGGKKISLDPGVFNMGPCPLPGGKIVFTTNRDGFRPAKGYPRIALQLFVMDDRDESIGDDEDPQNLEKIGHLNISGALHPVVLFDGRIMFSSLESQGMRGDILWGIWTIHPDGTKWAPLVSAFDPGGAPNGFHFQTQISDGSIVFEEYYNQNNSGFGTLMKMPDILKGYETIAFGPGDMQDPRNKPWRQGRHDNGKASYYRMPFMPTGSEAITPFTHSHDAPAGRSDMSDKASPHVGKFTHPSGAPDNHLLTCYSPGPANHQYTFNPQIDGGIYLIKGGKSIDEPAQMLLIKNDPRYNECWPRAVVPYSRIFGLKEPQTIPRVKNDGKQSKELPAGTPFGLVGSSSLYKRESYPNGKVPAGKVTAEFRGGSDPWKGLDPFTSHGNGMPINWHNQGSDAGLYDNSEIHAIRILAMEPTTDRGDGRKQFFNHANERLRILGEIPVRKFAGKEGKQPTDPDGMPDTSFLAKLPADTAYTFQTIDKRGLLLNAAQTWHQLRPGEIRNDCGGCHSHSQKPTLFEKTAAASPDYKVWDLTQGVPLITSKASDESKKQWDAEDQTGLRTLKETVVNVEYFRDIQPILAKSCIACHTKSKEKPAGNLVLDADDELISVENKGKLPGTYIRLAADERAKFGHKPVGYDTWGYPNASRYIRAFQARRSLLVWKIFGERLDGFTNDDHPSEATPGDRTHLIQAGKEVPLEKNGARWDLDFVGSQMPPPKAVADGLVKPLTDEDRRTILRWIDLGCPIDLAYDPKNPGERGAGFLLDENRPVLTLAVPQESHDGPLDRIVIGAYDYFTGLDAASLKVTADFAVDEVPAGENLAGKFKPAGPAAPGVWEWKLAKPVTSLPRGTISISIKDNQGNISRVNRTFSVKGKVASQ